MEIILKIKFLWLWKCKVSHKVFGTANVPPRFIILIWFEHDYINKVIFTPRAPLIWFQVTLLKKKLSLLWKKHIITVESNDTYISFKYFFLFSYSTFMVHGSWWMISNVDMVLTLQHQAGRSLWTNNKSHTMLKKRTWPPCLDGHQDGSSTCWFWRFLVS